MTAILLYPILGCSIVATFWSNFFAATGEYFYHANLESPKWLRYFIQTPELHSVHHQFDVHPFNFGDIPVWDRLFGTYQDRVSFTGQCGLRDGAEQRIFDMLRFRGVHDSDRA